MKSVMIVVASLAALVVVVVVVIGMALPQSHVARRSAHLSIPPDKVWSIVTDVSSYPAWRPEVASVEKLPSVGGKLAWREVSAKGNKLSYDAPTADARSHFVTRITDTGIPFGGSWDYKIEPDGAGTRITITENGEVYNPIFRFVSKYLMGYTASLDKYLRSLAAKAGDTYVPAATS